MPVEKGRMTNLNFDSYEIMRLAEMPKVETVIVPTYDFWGGVGEPTICVVAPAVLNAIYRRDRQAGAQPAAEERQAGLRRSYSAVPRRSLPVFGEGGCSRSERPGGDCATAPHPTSLGYRLRSVTLPASRGGMLWRDRARMPASQERLARRPLTM